LRVVILENDALGIPHSDRNYTMGLSIADVQKGTRDKNWVWRNMFGFLAAINSGVGLDKEGPGKKTQTVTTAGSINYTPRNLVDPTPQLGDRPYASLFYVGVGYLKVLDENDPYAFQLSSEWQLGLLGTNIGKVVQTEIHEWCCKEKIPAGWDNQIGDGGALTFLYAARWHKLLSIGAAPFGLRYELRGSVGGDVGYFTRGVGTLALSVGGTEGDLAAMRLFGVVNGIRALSTSPDIRLQMLEPPPARTESMTDSKTRRVRANSGFGLWIAYEGSAFGYNQLLQGAWAGRNRVTIDRDDIESYVHHTTIGVGLTWLVRWLYPAAKDSTHLYWTQHWRSRDIKTSFGEEKRYGGLTFVWSLP
jgi:hypothetical protein